MERNKEEAVRALQVAEKKLHANDFMGARKMAQLAQRLYPELENVNQLLAIAEVLCSAENKISDLKYDLYGILQIQRTADQETIRKQYRKLSLLLHPDKNKFIGAEAAFKLIGEANGLLTDILKRSLYDMKLRESQKTDSHKLPQQPSKASNSSQNASYSQSSGVNTTKLQISWTACSFCNTRLQFLRAYVNRMLRCHSCGNDFIAHDLGYHNVPHGSSMGHTPTPNIPTNVGAGSSSTMYPQRPGQIECDYYMKTGACKFGERCKFHHPVDSSTGNAKNGSQQNVKLTLAGLPRREGICKYGAICKFDHPPPGEVMAMASQGTSTTD